MLLFLDALPEPVVPYAFYQQCLECCSDAVQCEKVLTCAPSACWPRRLLRNLRKRFSFSLFVKVVSTLPQCHRNVFNYVAAFLRELLKNSPSNRLDVTIVGKTKQSFFCSLPFPISEGTSLGHPGCIWFGLVFFCLRKEWEEKSSQRSNGHEFFNSIELIVFVGLFYTGPIVFFK